MKIIELESVKSADTPHKVLVRKMLSFEHASIVHIELKPGESLKKHITPVDACFYVIEGNGSVEIGDEIKKVKKDDLIFSPAKIVHRLFNSENSKANFKFLVIKTPTPESETKVL
ncbi:cupin domain-containing protein [Promethearchaeum syntrophicum]|uniref:Cupin domain-containing protein n=1 Tax=Promethearchaeum syntrophicum TaxID=2594042 RepID=A0A5B9DED4_9ARCH|nr:cupin domain-containing protein [Candidatus Prometheoarchaeum syntrophicum]QEE17474.1 Cupin domain protein [Candidatus Prometheoarchaeum syntrophicum]